MTTDEELNELRRSALTKIDSTRKLYIFWLFLAGGTEATGIILLCVLVDFGDRLHQILLAMTFLTYGTLALCMMWLGAYTKWWALQILKGVELLTPAAGSRADERGDS